METDLDLPTSVSQQPLKGCWLSGLSRSRRRSASEACVRREGRGRYHLDDASCVCTHNGGVEQCAVASPTLPGLLEVNSARGVKEYVTKEALQE